MHYVLPRLSTAPVNWSSVSGCSPGGVTMVRSISRLNGVLGPLTDPVGVSTVNGVTSYAKEISVM